MTNFRINHESRTIEMTAAFAKSASIYGEEDYTKLVAAKRDFPDYAVKTCAPKKSKAKFKNLTLENIENYIRKHDDDNNTNLTIFATLRGMELKNGKLVETDDDFAEVAAFAQIKKWFLDTYSEAFDNYGTNVNKLLEDANRKARENREARKAA